MSCTFLPEVVDPADGRKQKFEPNSVLLLRGKLEASFGKIAKLTFFSGPGHNLMRERPDGATEESLTALQALEERLAKVAEAKGLKLYAAQSNVEGECITL